MVNTIRFVVIFFVVAMIGAPGAIALLRGIVSLYPSITLISFFLGMLAVGVIFGFSFRSNMPMTTVISGLILESLAGILAFTQWHSGTIVPWVGGLFWFVAAMGIAMCVDEMYMRRTNRLHG